MKPATIFAIPAPAIVRERRPALARPGDDQPPPGPAQARERDEKYGSE